VADRAAAPISKSGKDGPPRPSDHKAMARRELEDLRAAINYHRQ
jgi:hypothetical protein